MEAVLQFLSSIHRFSDELMEHFEALIKTRSFSKRDYLLRAGHTCRHIYFIEQGLLRCFYLKDDHEVCSWFMQEGDVVVSVESFYHQTPSYESIQALEDCVVKYVGYGELQELYHRYPELNFVGRVLTEKYYCLSEQRLYSLRMQRAQERYEYLLQHHGELVLRVPAKYLASYLGITEVTMSKIRSRA